MVRTYVNPNYAANFGNKSGYLDKDVAVKVQPAPTKGWDALTPIAAMEPEYAVVLDNWVPRTGYCEIRGGSNPWCQGLGIGSAPLVNSLMVYRPEGTDSEVMFAAAAPYIYNVSTYGVPSISVSGLQSDKFQYINFTPDGGQNWLLCVNGADPYLGYSDGEWFAMAVTGVDSRTFNTITMFKRRIWFSQANSTSAYYLGVDAVQGPATEFNIGSLMSRGGRIQNIVTWTLDGGQGPDDYIVFITSKAQYIVYKGTDPDNAEAFAHIGTFDMVPAIGTRCATKYGSDVLVITEQGVVPLSQSLPFDPSAARSSAITNRIQNAMLQSAQLYKDLYGWQLQQFPAQGLLLLNVPTVDAAQSVQYVMNTLTGAWCSFSGWNAMCFEIFNGSLYFGGVNGTVYLAYAGATDTGAPITYRMSCAYNYFDEPGRIKTANMLRPYIQADAAINPTVNIDTDFATSVPSVSSTGLLNASLWDSAIWDTSTWGYPYVSVLNWLSVNGLGTALSINMAINLSITGSSSPYNVFDTGVFDTMVFDGSGSIDKSGVGIPTLRVTVFEIAIENGGPI